MMEEKECGFSYFEVNIYRRFPENSVRDGVSLRYFNKKNRRIVSVDLFEADSFEEAQAFERALIDWMDGSAGNRLTLGTEEYDGEKWVKNLGEVMTIKKFYEIEDRKNQLIEEIEILNKEKLAIGRKLWKEWVWSIKDHFNDLPAQLLYKILLHDSYANKIFLQCVYLSNDRCKSKTIEIPEWYDEDFCELMVIDSFFRTNKDFSVLESMKDDR